MGWWTNRKMGGWDDRRIMNRLLETRGNEMSGWVGERMMNGWVDRGWRGGCVAGR